MTDMTEAWRYGQEMIDASKAYLDQPRQTHLALTWHNRRVTYTMLNEPAPLDRIAELEAEIVVLDQTIAALREQVRRGQP